MTTASFLTLSSYERVLSSWSGARFSYRALRTTLIQPSFLSRNSFVEFGALLKRGDMRDDERRIDFAVFNQSHKLWQIELCRRLRHPEREPTIDG